MRIHGRKILGFPCGDVEVEQQICDFYIEEDSHEFVIEVEDSDKFLEKLKASNILGGIKIDATRVLVCTTEMNTEEEIVNYIEAV